MVSQDECQDCGGVGAVYEHGPSCRTDLCAGNGDYWSCTDGDWLPCPSCEPPPPAASGSGD